MNASLDNSMRGTWQPIVSCACQPLGAEGATSLYIKPYLHPALAWREPMIQRAAYLRSLNRGFRPGKELEDWLTAEQEIDHLIACGAAPYR